MKSGLVIVSFILLALPVQAADKRCHVARAQFTTSIVNREPVDQVLVLKSGTYQNLFYFTDMRHCQGKTLTHRWEFEGRIVSEVPFIIKGPRWRVYSKKFLEPGKYGKWSVLVVDEAGWPMHATIFYYGAKPETRKEPAPSHLVIPDAD